MLVAIYLTTSQAPRLYGVDVVRVVEADMLRVSVAKTDVLITDTAFDTATVPIKRCCVLKGAPGIESFAVTNGLDCIDATQVAAWFESRLGIDVSRRARQITQEAPAQVGAISVGADTSKYKVMYDGLVSELCKSDMYRNLDPTDAKTYDVLLNTVKGTLRKADSVAGEMSLTHSKLVKAEADLAQLQRQTDVTDEDMRVALSGLSQAVSESSSVLNKLVQLTGEADLLMFSGVAVKARAALGLASKFASVSGAHELRAVGSVMREFTSCVVSIVDDLLKLGSTAVRESSGAQSASHVAAMAKAEAERLVSQANELVEQERMTSENLRQQLSQMNTAYQEQLQRASSAENQILVSGSASLPALNEQIRTLRFELQSKQDQIASMEEAMQNAAQSEDANGGLAPEVASGIIRQLRTQVASLKLERDRATAELAKAKRAAVKETERAETLANSARSLSQVALRGSQVSALPTFNYAAKALVIPVFGNGSTGISSSAVSLAKMLGVNSRVVLVDFDLMCTDLEGRFGEKINPLVRFDDGDTSGKHTAMGMFIERGKDFFTSHYAELVVRIDSNKAGILDYLPGFYAKPDLFMLTQADYTTLLNYLGSRYDYIIFDMGKLGGSEISDQIIRNLCACAFRSLIVTDASVEKTRAMRLKLTDVFGADLRKLVERSVWLTNRATKREDLTRFTAPAQSVVIPVLSEMVGLHDSFHITTGAQREFNKVVRALAGV